LIVNPMTPPTPPKEKQIWFPAKRYGYGWGPPCCWQGWVAMAIWVALLAGGGIILLPAKHVDLFVAWTAIMVVALMILCLIKGDKPRWRWGKD
jgi:hypothetical protein